ncbi:hypothetical protein HY571_03035 [Candidatus Micrarchaeota archaeon]|nr:hypothetical protein [Candidatus Micrarchaeota archaeon]
MKKTSTYICQLGQVKHDVLGRIRLGKLEPADRFKFAFPRAKAILLRSFQADAKEKELLANVFGGDIGQLYDYSHHIALTNRLGVGKTIALLSAAEEHARYLLLEVENLKSARRRASLLHAAGSEQALSEHGDVIQQVLSDMSVKSQQWLCALKDKGMARAFLSSASGRLSGTRFRELIDFMDSVHHRKA